MPTLKEIINLSEVSKKLEKIGLRVDVDKLGKSNVVEINKPKGLEGVDIPALLSKEFGNNK